MTSPFPQIDTPPQALAEVLVNENLAALKHQAVYAYAFQTSSGLVWGYYGGRWGGFSVAAGTLTLTNAADNYVVVAIATGAISTSTSATNWNNATDYARVYKLTTAGGVVTAEEDHRAGPGGIGGGAGGGGAASTNWKIAVRAATTANGTLATAFENGDTVDGVTLATGDRILLKNQSSGAENGIYVVAASGAPARAVDADSAAELVTAVVVVSEGATNADRIYEMTTNAPITVGSTSLTWTQIGSAPVTSVAGRTGAVTLTVADIGSSLDIRNLSGMTLANDGTTDDAAVFAAALASGAKYINARGLNCAILTQVSLAAGVTLDISGSTITTTGSTLTTFKADTIDDWALIADGATIIGAGSTVGTAKAIHVVGCNRGLVRGLRAKNIKGHGFYLAPGTPSGSARGDQIVFANCLAEACYWGWEDTPGAGAEYSLVSNFRASGCTTWGAKTSAGNIQWNGGNIVDNVGDGLVMVGGTNHAHGMCVGLNVNHNGTYNLNASGIVNGQSFVGCHFYEKIILLDGCKGVTFTGGAIDTPTITVNSGTGSGACLMQGVFFPGSYGAPGAIGGTDVPSLISKDCYGPGNLGNTDLRIRSASTATSYTLDDECLLHPSADTTARTFTIPANSSVPFPIGKVLSGINQHSAGVITLAITTDTMRWLGNSGSTGSRTIAADGSWAAQKVAATEWAVTGVGMT